MSKRIKSILTVTLLILVVLSNLMIGMAEETLIIEEKASMSDMGFHMSSVELNGKIYTMGGTNSSTSNISSVKMYDPELDAWVDKAPMNTARKMFGAVAYNGKIYVFGGNSANGYLSSVEEYNPQTNTWSYKQDMPLAREFCKAEIIDNKIYVLGGRTGSTSFTNKMYMYNPDNDTWEEKAQTPFTSLGFGLTSNEDKLYVMGGYYSGGVIQKETYIYTATTDTWEKGTDMLVAKYHHDIISSGGKIYSLFGIGAGNNNYLGSEVYDIASDTWNTISFNQEHKIDVFDCVLLNNSIYIVGGKLFNSSSSSYTLNHMFKINLPEQSIPSPTNLTATPANAQITLNWNAVDGAESYNVKRSTTQGGPYTTIANNVTTTTYVDTNVTNGTTYYYVVTAVKAGSESVNSNEASATPVAPIINRAFLHITMQNGFIKEYDMAMTEVDSFISWYNSTSGSNLYTINKHNNIGPFLNRKNYLVKDKILFFEVMEYENNN